MTTTTPHLPACPDWCQIDASMHREDFDGDDPRDGLPLKHHGIEFDEIRAESQQRVPGAAEQPHLFVSVARRDKLFGGHMVTGDVRIALVTEGYPHFTVAEIDRVIATLQDARARAVEITSS